MAKRKSILFLAGISCLLLCCREEIKNNKDMEQNMMDIRIYQENLGEQLMDKNLDDAEWFLEGMDSILRLLIQRFPEHRRLSRPFSHFYDKEMKEPVNGIREAIRSNDTAAARKSYRLLIKNCNSCHIDNDVDKTVTY